MSLCNLLRIPILFLMDELVKTGFEFPNLAGIVYFANNDFDNGTLSQFEIGEFTQYYKAIFLSFIKIIVSCLIFYTLSCLFVLPVKNLYLLYLHVVCVCIGTISFCLNIHTLKDEHELQVGFGHFSYILFRNIILPYTLSLVFDFLQYFTPNQSICKASSLIFMIPNLIIPILPPGTWIHEFLNTVTVLSILLPLFFMLKTLWLDLLTITNKIRKKCIRIRRAINNLRINYLLHVVGHGLRAEWNRIKIPRVLRMFWALRVLIQIPYLITDMEIQNETLFGVVKILLINGSDTSLAVLGMTSFVSYFCHYIGAFIQWVLLTDDVDDNKIGTFSAVLFYILTLQIGLTGKDPEERFIIIYNSVCLLCACLLHYIHELMVITLLESLNFILNPPLNRYLRALLVNIFLILFSITMMTMLWSHHSVSTWLLSVSSLTSEIIIKVLVSIAVYSLVLINDYRTIVWEEFDDYVYYIKLFGRMMEFCLAIFFVLKSVYIMAFGSNGVFRVSTIFIHLYSSIWCNARDGWREFIKRRTAVEKIKTLLEATSVQLSELNDVCAICFQNMGSAKITRCNHYFHGVCLHKWIYVQDRCPLCHDIL